MIKRIRKLMQAGIVLGVLGLGVGQALACYIHTGVNYRVDADGTGSVGPFDNGLITFNGDETSGHIAGTVYGRWYDHGVCEMTWSGDYTLNGAVMPGLAYNLTVNATGACVPKNAPAATLILIPSDNGIRFGFGIYDNGSHIHGTGEQQDIPVSQQVN